MTQRRPNGRRAGSRSERLQRVTHEERRNAELDCIGVANGEPNVEVHGEPRCAKRIDDRRAHHHCRKRGGKVAIMSTFGEHADHRGSNNEADKVAHRCAGAL